MRIACHFRPLAAPGAVLALAAAALVLFGMASRAAATSVTIMVENFRFDADNNDATQIDTVTIVQGDTVHWQRVAGSHTVTNGDSSSAPGAGTIFDSPINSGSPSFTFVFTDPGEFPYFCIPHESLNMKGRIVVQPAVGIGDEGRHGNLPRALHLAQNAPNPFNPSTIIHYDLPEQEGGGLVPVNLTVYSLRGEKVRTLVAGLQTPGSYVVRWDGADGRGAEAASGIYIYRLQAGRQGVSRKMVLLK